jgi:hypothetical protein
VSTHREENVDRREKFFLTLPALNRNLWYPVILSTHLRTQKRIDEWYLPVRIAKPFGFTDM